ncbi:substrate-binding domain-containing protein [Peristeroidobacter soli]|uniref:substrate-binding domain-containing protein n=1 Tax=Peristeroidobacter soli TaxID=2497877 RepID=UPI0013002A2C|nr:substrate-binding domain-containing protein [Peristeroidobacter soli]
MNDEFLTSLRRQPPAQFSRELKRKLQAQDAQQQRRFWPRRFKTLLLLIAGPALATGIFIFERSPPAAAPPTTLATEPRQTLAAPTDTSPAPQEQQPPAAAPEQTLPVEAPPARPAVKIATSPQARGFIQTVVDGLQPRSSNLRPQLQEMEAGAAFAALCSPESVRQVDIVISSRRITREEFMTCRRHGGGNVTESKAGYQALVLTGARDSRPMKLTARDVYLALARQVPDQIYGTSIDNPNITWDQVNRKLPYRPIKVLGPASYLPLRQLFENLLLDAGCNLAPAQPDVCHALRIDGVYAEVEQSATLIPQYLWTDPNALVLVDYEFYRDNRSQLAGSALEGPEPSSATLADGTYSLARPIYVYTDVGRIGRAADGPNIMQSLLSPRLPNPNQYGFVRIDERERKNPWHPLSESDLIPQKE